MVITFKQKWNILDEMKNESLARATSEQNTINQLRGECDARIREMATLQNSVTEQRETLTSLTSNTVQIRRDVDNVATNISAITLRIMSE